MATFITGTGIQGAAELERRLMQLGTEVGTKLVQAADRQAAKLVGDAVRDAAPDGPKAEGDSDGKRGPHAKIKDNIKLKKGKSATRNAATVIVHTGKAYHALFQERGTIHIAPRPFMGPAFARTKDTALAKMGTALERGIERAARTGSAGTSPDGGVKLDD